MSDPISPALPSRFRRRKIIERYRFFRVLFCTEASVDVVRLLATYVPAASLSELRSLRDLAEYFSMLALALSAPAQRSWSA